MASPSKLISPPPSPVSRALERRRSSTNASPQQLTELTVNGLTNGNRRALTAYNDLVNEIRVHLSSDDELDRILEAVRFSTETHQGQICKDGTTPYVIHPLNVAVTLVKELHCIEPNLIIAALIHGSIRRGTTSLREIQEQFGEQVRQLASLNISNQKPLPVGIRLLTSKKPSRESKLAEASYLRSLVDNQTSKSELAKQALLLNLSEIINNVRDLDEHPPVDWTDEQKLTYHESACEIAQTAVGLSSSADDLIGRTFRVIERAEPPESSEQLPAYSRV